MTTKTVSSVIDEINEWNNPKGGTIYYVTCFFTDGDVGSVGRKDRDAAIEVQGLLQEAIEVEQDFTLESKGQTKNNKNKWNIKAFGAYTAPAYVPGGTGAPNNSQVVGSRRSPEHDQAKDESIARAVALKAAVECRFLEDELQVLTVAEYFLGWLTKNSGSPPPPSENAAPAEASSGDAAQGGPEPTSEGVGTRGEADPAPSDHIHDFYPRQGVKSHDVCDCGATQKKAAK